MCKSNLCSIHGLHNINAYYNNIPKLCEFPMCLCLNFVLIDEYAIAYLVLMIQNGYAYRFCDMSICQKYHTEWALQYSIACINIILKQQ